MTLAAPTPFGSVASAERKRRADTRNRRCAHFGIDTDMQVKGVFARPDAHVPDIDQDYLSTPRPRWPFWQALSHNRRVMVQGYHGTGKSTHIEQVAARLNWPCMRVNLDSHISPHRPGRQGRHRHPDGMQVTEFREGILPWALQHQHRAGVRRIRCRPPGRDVRDPARSGSSGRLTLLDQNRVIRPHPAFRLFATANTVGLGDTSGLYHGTQQINQGPDGPLVVVTCS
jgi:cobaltochelatase CobS